MTTTDDVRTYPWHDDCPRCQAFAAENEVDIFSWHDAVREHFGTEHHHMLGATYLSEPVPYLPAVLPEPLTDAEQRELLDKVRDLHALAMYVKENVPPVIEAIETNPMFKMFGGKLFGN